MKLISLEEIRATIESETTRPDIYYVPEGRLLSPAAKDYLNTMCIRFDNESRRPKNEQRAESTRYLNQNYISRSNTAGQPVVGGNRGDLTTGSGVTTDNAFGVTAARTEAPAKLRFYGYRTHTPYGQKPEAMTHIEGNKLVMKDDPVIQYRGKLDTAQAQVVFVQSLIAAADGCPHLLSDLDDILATLRDLMRAEVLNEPVSKTTVLGLTHEELRAQSHDPEQYFGVPPMQLPSYEMGTAFAGLNLLRTTIREAEVLAVHAFKQGTSVKRNDLVEQLNRLSSAVHILMCRYRAGRYTKPQNS